MGKRRTYMRQSQDELRIICGAWATHPRISDEVADHLLFGTEGSDQEPHSFALARYDFKGEWLSRPRALLSMEEGSLPRVMAVHPRGNGVVVSFATGCKLFEWAETSNAAVRNKQGIELRLQPSERNLTGLEDVGPQNRLVFNVDGSVLASGGEDGHIRVFRWPSMDIVIDLPRAHKSVKDLDISFDCGFIAATAENSSCRVWSLLSSEEVATLVPEKGESFGFSRFSRDGRKAFLFITVTKGKGGSVGVWDMTNWTRIGARRFANEPITSLAITNHGRRLAIGTIGGDICIIEVAKMQSEQTTRTAHLQGVVLLEFSWNNKALLSLSSDNSARVTALDLSKEWKEWQMVLLLIGMIVGSMVLFYLFYLYGDAFFQYPQSRDQGAIRPIEPILSSDELASQRRHQEL